MVDVDFRLSVMVSLCIPLFTSIIVGVVYVVVRAKIKLRVAIEQKTEFRNSAEHDAKMVGKLFDQSDFDMSGDIDTHELQHMFVLIAGNNPHTIHRIQTMTTPQINRVMVNVGGVPIIESIPSSLSTAVSGIKTYTIDRQTFITATITANTNSVWAKFVPLYRVSSHVQQTSLQSNSLSVLVQLFVLFHAPISARAFYYFDCHKLGRKKSFVRRDYSLECGSEKYKVYLPVAWIIIVGFAIGLPVALAGFLLYHRNDLHSPTTRSKIGWLYSRFKKGSEFWEGRLFCIHSTSMLIFFQPLTLYCFVFSSS